MNTLAPDQVVSPSESPDIDSMKRADVPAIWDGYRAQLSKLKATAETLIVTDVSQKAEMKLARVTRLTLKDLRVEIEHRRKELGEEALRRKQGIDNSARELRELIEPLEIRLLEQEQFAERQEAAERARKVTERTADIRPFWNAGLPLPDLGAMTDEQFGLLMVDTKAAYEAKIAAAKKAEEDRLAKEAAEAAERRRISEENARLKKEAEDREASILAERQRAEAAANKAALKARREREAELAKLHDQQAAIEAKAKAEREAAEAEARKEREAREKAEGELRAKQQAEEKAKKEAAASARKAARAPDKTKLFALAESLKATQRPTLTSIDGMAILSETNERLNALVQWLEQKAGEL